MTDKKYNIIYADPPWKYGSKELYGDKVGGQEKRINRFRKIERIYRTLSLQDLKSIPVKKIIDEDCACFMWVTDSHLKEGIELMDAWGFKYKTVAFTWIKHHESGKLCINFAPWTLKSWEICLLGTRGTMGKYKKSNNVRGLIEAVRTKHSKKPEAARERIGQLFGDVPRLELFAREKSEDWDVWGDEVECDINLDERGEL